MPAEAPKIKSLRDKLRWNMDAQYRSLIDDSQPTSKDTQPNRLLSTSCLRMRQEKHSKRGTSQRRVHTNPYNELYPIRQPV